MDKYFAAKWLADHYPDTVKYEAPDAGILAAKRFNLYRRRPVRGLSSRMRAVGGVNLSRGVSGSYEI